MSGKGSTHRKKRPLTGVNAPTGAAHPAVPADLPDAFLTRMQTTLGETYDCFVKSYEELPARALLLNSLRGVSLQAVSDAFVPDGPVPWEANGFYFTENGEGTRQPSVSPDQDSPCPAGKGLLLHALPVGNRPGRHPLHEAGAWYIQEPSAMLPARMLLADTSAHGAAASSDDLRVLDLCAAPGGKSVQLAMLLAGRGLLISNEIHEGRARILSQNIERMGIVNAIVLNETPEHLADRFAGCFDRVLVDAPCSGEGMFRKNPAAIAEWSPETVDRCAARQAVILDRAAEMLAPGGLLVYSTCTFAEQEDEEQIEAFLHRHGDFSCIEEQKLFPHRIHGEGHYCALLLRMGQAPGVLPASAQSLSFPSRSFSPDSKPRLSHVNPSRAVHPDRAILKQLSEWMCSLLPDSAWNDLKFQPDRLLNFGEHLYLAPQGNPDLTGLRVLRPGLHLADIKAGRNDLRIEPAHALSHTAAAMHAALTVSLTAEEALIYLNGQALRTASLSSPVRIHGADGEEHSCESHADWKGDVLVTLNGLGLGWARLTDGLLKNRYPKGLRV